MEPLDPLALLPAGPKTRDPFPGPERDRLEAFEKVIDGLVSRDLSRKTPSGAAVQAQQDLEAFRRKLAVLTGMLEQARAAMASEVRHPGGPAGPNERKYQWVRSKLGQVGLPDGSSNIL